MTNLLLIGPYDPCCGEYTFLAPPLGVWRLAGYLQAAGVRCRVFDPNCCDGAPEKELRALLGRRWDAVGFSTTGMTLVHDLALAHLARRTLPGTCLVAGGIQATFRPEELFRLGPFDLVVLGEGERPLRELARRLGANAPLEGIAGTAWRKADGTLQSLPQPALSRDELREAIFAIPYEQMPYRRYWQRLERAWRVGQMAVKAEREARLAEIRSVRLITLNYCPMNCTFCSSTQFLHAAAGATVKIARLDAGECLAMLQRICAAYPEVRTVIFQDDIFAFTNDRRLEPLCREIVSAKAHGELPPRLSFISTNRVDAMTPERLAWMRRAGFRVLGFGVENFAPGVLAEFNKKHIHSFIEPTLGTALRLGITPFLDIILTSPRCRLRDLAETVRQAYRWTLAGCEIGMYPYVIPFAGAPMAEDPELQAQTVCEERWVAGTAVRWRQPVKILPMDPVVRQAILDIEGHFERHLAFLDRYVPHLPSRVRSLLWIWSAVPVLSALGQPMPDRAAVAYGILTRLPGLSSDEQTMVGERLGVPLLPVEAGRR